MSNIYTKDRAPYFGFIDWTANKITIAQEVAGKLETVVDVTLSGAFYDSPLDTLSVPDQILYMPVQDCFVINFGYQARLYTASYNLDGSARGQKTNENRHDWQFSSVGDQQVRHFPTVNASWDKSYSKEPDNYSTAQWFAIGGNQYPLSATQIKRFDVHPSGNWALRTSGGDNSVWVGPRVDIGSYGVQYFPSGGDQFVGFSNTFPTKYDASFDGSGNFAGVLTSNGGFNYFDLYSFNNVDGSQTFISRQNLYGDPKKLIADPNGSGSWFYVSTNPVGGGGLRYILWHYKYDGTNFNRTTVLNNFGESLAITADGMTIISAVEKRALRRQPDDTWVEDTQFFSNYSSSDFRAADISPDMASPVITSSFEYDLPILTSSSSANQREASASPMNVETTALGSGGVIEGALRALTSRSIINVPNATQIHSTLQSIKSEMTVNAGFGLQIGEDSSLESMQSESSVLAAPRLNITNTLPYLVSEMEASGNGGDIAAILPTLASEAIIKFHRGSIESNLQSIKSESFVSPSSTNLAFLEGSLSFITSEMEGSVAYGGTIEAILPEMESEGSIKFHRGEIDSSLEAFQSETVINVQIPAYLSGGLPKLESSITGEQSPIALMDGELPFFINEIKTRQSTWSTLEGSLQRVTSESSILVPLSIQVEGTLQTLKNSVNMSGTIEMDVFNMLPKMSSRSNVKVARSSGGGRRYRFSIGFRF